MAVRRQLGLLFQEPQVGGVIMVERNGFEAGNCQHGQQSSKAPENPKEKGLGARGIQLEDCMLFQCRNCRTVLGDSLSLCAQEEKQRLFVLFKVTNEVVVHDKLMICVDGDLIGCTYNMLSCRSCERDIGLRLYSSKSLAYLRGFFCFFKDNVTCYSLKTKTTSEGSKMVCPLLSLKDRIQKLKENLVLMHLRIDKLLKQIELNQQRIAMEKQSYKARPHAQTPVSTKRKLNN